MRRITWSALIKKKEKTNQKTLREAFLQTLTYWDWDGPWNLCFYQGPK